MKRVKLIALISIAIVAIVYSIAIVFISDVANQCATPSYICPYQIISDSMGIRAEQYDFTIKKNKKKWSGKWIWLNKTVFKDYQKTKTQWGENSGYKEQYRAIFRKKIELDSIPNQAIISITADIFFRLYINGILVTQGPANIGHDYFDGVPPEHWFFDSYNIKNFLKIGTNTIVVEVYSHYREISETSSGEGMFICDLDTSLNANILKTDETWKCNIDTSFFVRDRNYISNANKAILNCYSNSFNDSEWTNASVKDFPIDEYLLRSEIPIPFRYLVKPQKNWQSNKNTLVKDSEFDPYNKKLYDSEFLIDYGRNITGYYSFDITAHKNDTIKICPYEKKNASQNRALTFICKEGKNIFDVPYLSVYRYLKVNILSKNGLKINKIHSEFSSYPVTYTGSFSCSDSNITDLWDITRWTTQLCMNDMFYDSPKHQEPIACTGDYFIHSLINYYSFGDKWLTRQTLIKTALMLKKNNYDMFHTSYSLLWVQMLYQYYQHTGDIELVKALLPHVNKLNLLFENYLDSEYLVSNAPDYMFMDWIEIDEFNAHHPPAVIGMGYMSAFYYKSLLDAASLNKLIDNKSIINHNMELAKKIKLAINKLLWDKEKKCFKDGIAFRTNVINHKFFPKDKNIVTYSPHFNTLTVLYDLAPKKQQTQIMNYVVNQKDIQIQPYFMFFVLSAVERVNQFNTVGVELLKKWEYGIDKETHTLKEIWQEKTESGYGGDYSHAWGGAPLYFISKNILGVKPGIPGYKEIEITPFINKDISWAKGKVPLGYGLNIEISWERKDEQKYIYVLNFPEGFNVFMIFPKNNWNDEIKVNNKIYTNTTTRIPLRRGINEFSIL